MSKALDLTGQKFGRLTVVSRAENSKKGNTRWRCTCECGNQVTALAYSLKSKNTKSCGCIQRPDLTGKRFGRLVVLSREGTTKWECLCDCGESTIVQTNNLNREVGTRSCGCLLQEARSGVGKSHALSVNHDFFKTWTPEMAWVLGFWAADGNACQTRGQVRISFSQNDKEILETVKNVIGSEHKVFSSRKGYGLAFCSDSIYEDLCSIFRTQCLYKKSLTLPFPKIDKNHVDDFARGCIDGDGCISFDRGSPTINLSCGSRDFLYGIQALIFDQTGIFGNISPCKSIYRLQWGSIKAKCMAGWLYNNSKIALKRKKAKARKVLMWKSRKPKQSSLTPKMCHMFPHLIPEKYRERCLAEAEL